MNKEEKLLKLFSELINNQYHKYKIENVVHPDLVLNVLRNDFDKLIKEINTIGINHSYDLICKTIIK